MRPEPSHVRKADRSPARSADREENGLSDHKFKIGQIVSYTSGPYGRASGLFRITQLLPPEGDDMQYRIKSDTEPHERVVKESQLSNAS